MSYKIYFFFKNKLENVRGSGNMSAMIWMVGGVVIFIVLFNLIKVHLPKTYGLITDKITEIINGEKVNPIAPPGS